jgi:hypothetical protein
MFSYLFLLFYFSSYSLIFLSLVSFFCVVITHPTDRELKVLTDNTEALAKINMRNKASRLEC